MGAPSTIILGFNWYRPRLGNLSDAEHLVIRITANGPRHNRVVHD